MICLEEIRLVVVIHLRFFNLTPMHGPGRRRNWRPCDGPACASLSFSVAAVGVEDRPPLGDLGRALRHRPKLAPWLPHEGLANGEGGLGHELVPPGAVLRQVFPFGEHRREIEVVQVTGRRSSLGRRRRGALGSRRA